MTVDSTPATVVLVHGAFHGAWCWDRVVPLLERAGVPVHAVDLPGHGDDDGPPGDLHAHADWLRGFLAAVEWPVVLVGHSYGGAVVTEAAAGAPGVAWLVYLCALVPDVGEAIDAAMLEPVDDEPVSLVPDAMRMDDDGYAVLDPVDAVAALYGDCSPGDVQFALARLGRQNVVGLAAPVRAAAWRTIPSTYVVCLEDRALTGSVQRLMASRTTDSVVLPTSHSPFFSQPGAVADILIDRATRVGAA